MCEGGIICLHMSTFCQIYEFMATKTLWPRKMLLEIWIRSPDCESWKTAEASYYTRFQLPWIFLKTHFEITGINTPIAYLSSYSGIEIPHRIPKQISHLSGSLGNWPSTNMPWPSSLVSFILPINFRHAQILFDLFLCAQLTWQNALVQRRETCDYSWWRVKWIFSIWIIAGRCFHLMNT